VFDLLADVEVGVLLLEARGAVERGSLPVLRLEVVVVLGVPPLQRLRRVRIKNLRFSWGGLGPCPKRAGC